MRRAKDKVLADLKNEVAILSQLRHPNVVLYIGACTVPPNVCIVTEWCDRGSLYDIIYKQKAIIDTRKIIDIATGLAQGMSYLHSLERSIIHRDLKSHKSVPLGGRSWLCCITSAAAVCCSIRTLQ